ncbi:MAG TPA: hypothetical protein VFA84_05445 [Acidimicrobiales bacterium]|nr:hypothetical protein [Acidimicrobiales bacterium]
MPRGLHLHRSPLTTATPIAAGQDRAGAARRSVGAAVGSVIAVVAVAWALAAASHSAGIPRTDDWAWARVAVSLHRTGHVRLVGWGPMTMVGLVVWAQPWLAAFGPHVWALDLGASLLAAAGLLGAWRLSRPVGGAGAGLVVVATIVLAPGFVRDTASFMTDGPAFALAALALLAGVEAAGAEGARRRWLEAACVVCGLWAFTIREFAIAAPLAVLGVRWLAERERRRPLAAQAGVVVACAAVFWAWRSSLSGGQPYGGRPPVFTIAALLVCVAFTTSLLLVPVLAATAPSWWPARHRAGRLAGMAAGAALAMVPVAYEPGSWSHRYQWLTGDYLDPRGINGNKLLLGSRPRLLPAAGWAAVEALAIAAGIVVLGLLGETAAMWWRARDRDGLARDRREGPGRARDWEEPANRALGRRILAAHLAVSALLVAAAVVRNGAVYDRYLWPLALSGAVLVVTAFPVVPFSRWHPAASQAALMVVCAFALVSLAVTLNSDAFDGARWRAARQAVSQGAAPMAVDGGFEWVGWHATGVADANAAGDATRPYWVAMVGEPAPCVEVAASRITLPGLTLERAVTWRTWLLFGRAHLYVYRRAGCASGGR